MATPAMSGRSFTMMEDTKDVQVNSSTRSEDDGQEK